MQNRVNPFGEIIETKARGAWMGNRGRIHNEQKQIVSQYKLSAWLICQLKFKGRKRQIMAPKSYTELFFLDEATAFAAGHRPCFDAEEKILTGSKNYGFTEIDNIIFLIKQALAR